MAPTDGMNDGLRNAIAVRAALSELKLRRSFPAFGFLHQRRNVDR
jgi:hypothetical protein